MWQKQPDVHSIFILLHEAESISEKLMCIQVVMEFSEFYKIWNLF